MKDLLIITIGLCLQVVQALILSLFVWGGHAYIYSYLANHNIAFLPPDYLFALAVFVVARTLMPHAYAKSESK